MYLKIDDDDGGTLSLYTQ